MPESVPLQRRVSLLGATAIGVGSMLGAGVFIVLAPAAATAGPWLPWALGLAAAVALLNALATVQLAVEHPVAGGVHAYARAEMGPRWGFMAGWAFLTGKTASCAAMALTAAAYLVGDHDVLRPAAAVILLLAVTGMNALGVERTARGAIVLGGVTVLVLVVMIVLAGTSAPATEIGAYAIEPIGITQAAALIFFAFAGYARIATLGEEVTDPRKNLPRAVGIAFVVVLGLYVSLYVALTHALGIAGLAASSTPLADAVAETGWAGPLVRGGAVAASLGALLALTAGLGRTALAMGRVGDLPRTLAVIGSTRGAPWRAELATTLLAVAIVLSGRVDLAIGLSSGAVLVYYSLAHLSAFRQRPERRLVPPWLNVVGLLACLGLALSLPRGQVVAVAVVLVVGLLARQAVARRDPR